MVTVEQVLFLFVVAGSLALFIHGRLRVDITAMLTLLSLVAIGVIAPDKALAGFASEPAIIVASVFVLSAGLSATGVTDRIGAWIGHAAGASEWRALLIIMPTVSLMAAVTHHLMVTAMMLPIVLRFARQQQLPASRLLMPMSLAASLGTTLTLFGAPAFLLAGNLLQRQTGQGLGMFELSPIGLALVAAGIVYVLLMRWLLPRRIGLADGQDYLRLDQYYTELQVTADSIWTGKAIDIFEKQFAGRLSVVDWMRAGASLQRSAQTLRAGDVLLVRASPDEIASMADEPGLALNAVAKYGDTASANGHSETGENQLVQVVVAPNSEFSGRSIGDIDFLRSFGVLVVGLWRKESWLADEMSQVRLREGDLLVLSGDAERYAELARHRGLLMMVPFTSTQKRRHRASAAALIMLAVVIAAATGLFSTPLVFLTGAVAMVLAGCVSVERAYSDMDVRIYVMIAGVIPLGAAMEQTGTANLLATQLLATSGDWSSLTMLLAMFGVAALLTQVLSDAATVVLLGPIAIAIATALQLPPQPFIACVAFGAVVSFLTPIGHHGNLLILGPGRYTFGDFLRVGLPLTALLALISCWMARALWLGGGLDSSRGSGSCETDCGALTTVTKNNNVGQY